MGRVAMGRTGIVLLEECVAEHQHVVAPARPPAPRRRRAGGPGPLRDRPPLPQVRESLAAGGSCADRCRCSRACSPGTPRRASVPCWCSCPPSDGRAPDERLARRVSRGARAERLARPRGWPVVVGTRPPRSRRCRCSALRSFSTRTTSRTATSAHRTGRRSTWWSSAPGATVHRWSSSRPPDAALLEAAPSSPCAAREHSDWRGSSCVTGAGRPRTGLIGDELVALFRRLLEDGSAHPDRRGAVLNRTGRARLLACADCGSWCAVSTAGAPSRGGDELVCPGCARVRPRVCAACGSTRSRSCGGRGAGGDGPVALVARSGRGGRPAPWRQVMRLEGRRVLLGTEPCCTCPASCRRGVPRLRPASIVLAHRRPRGALALLARAGRLVGARSAKARRCLRPDPLPDEPVSPLRCAATRARSAPPSSRCAASWRYRPSASSPSSRALARPSTSPVHGVEVTASRATPPRARHRARRLCDALARVPVGERACVSRWTRRASERGRT